MRNRFLWHSLSLLIVALITLGTIEPARAADDLPGWTLRFDLSWFDPSGDFVTTSAGGTRFEAGYDTGFGAGVRGEYRFSSRFGAELGVLSAASVDVSSGIFGGGAGSSVEVSTVTPITVGLNVHLTPDRTVDVYAGPLLALVQYSDIDFRTGIGTATTSVSVDNDVGWGALVGIDLPLGEHGWLAHGNVRYIDTDMKNSGEAFAVDSNFDPLIFSLGFGYRF